MEFRMLPYEKMAMNLVRSFLSEDYVDFEWDERVELRSFLRFTGKHKVFPLVSAIMLGPVSKAIPDSIRDEVEKQWKVVRVASRFQDAEYHRVLSKLNGAGVFPVILKGTSFQRFYPNPNMRSSSDLDIQVQQHEVEVVHKALLELGYMVVDFKDEPINRNSVLKERMEHWHHYPYTKKKGGILCIVEIHKPVSYLGIDLQQMRMKSNKHAIGSATVLTFNDEDAFIYACLHSIQHGYDLKGIYPRELCLGHYVDIILSLKVLKDLNTNKLCKRISEVNASKWIMHALLRARDLWPEAVNSELLGLLEGQASWQGHCPNWVYRDGLVSHFLHRLLRPVEAESQLIGQATKSYHNRPRAVCWRIPEEVPLEQFSSWERAISVDGSQDQSHPFLTQVSEVNREDVSRLDLGLGWNSSGLYIHGDVSGKWGSCDWDNIMLVFGKESLEEVRARIVADVRGVLPDDIMVTINAVQTKTIRNCIEYTKRETSVVNSFASLVTKSGNVYQVRAFIPWGILEVYPQSGKEMRFDVRVSDFDNESFTKENRTVWVGEQVYGILTLSDAKYGCSTYTDLIQGSLTWR